MIPIVTKPTGSGPEYIAIPQLIGGQCMALENRNHRDYDSTKIAGAI
jgi:hypothetical protein